MRTVLGAALVLAVAAAACGGGQAQLDVVDAASAPADYAYAIPPGAGEAFDRGEPLDILPGELKAHVGEVIEIANHDERGHLVGPFYVGAGETLRQRFASPGEFIGVCTVHASGRIVLEVEP
jgi:hypothetical protein